MLPRANLINVLCSHASEKPKEKSFDLPLHFASGSRKVRGSDPEV